MPIVVGIDGGLACTERPTGVGYHARSVLENILTRTEPGLDLHLYLPPGGTFPSLETGRKSVHYRPDFNLKLRNPWLTLRSYCDRTDIYFTFGHQLPRFVRGRSVVTIYDTIYEEFPECYPAGVPAATRAEVLQGLSRADCVVTGSEDAASNIRKFYKFNGRIEVTGHGTRSCFSPGPVNKSWLGKYDLQNSRYFLYVGRIDARKNVKRIIEAYRRVLATGEACSLVLVGPQDTGSAEVDELLQQTFSSDEKIVRTGYLPEDELINLYRGAVGFIYPSLAEGFGLPVLEAMACGTPTVTSNRSALVEAAGRAALLVNPEDPVAIGESMGRLLTQDECSPSLKALGLVQAASFSWTKTVDILLRLFSELSGKA